MSDPAVPPPREIDENTPLASLSQAEIAQLTEKMLQQEPSTRTKLIAELTSLSSLRDEYIDGSQSVVRQIDWLQAHGFTKVSPKTAEESASPKARKFRRAARDGNCYWRSVAFSYLDRLLHSGDIPATVERFRSVLHSKEPGLTLAFNDSDIHKEFSEPLFALIQTIQDFGAALTTEDLLENFLQASDHISYYFRLVASAEIRTHPEPYRDFIGVDIVEFCQSQVEAIQSEADHIAMMALCNALRITLKLATLSSHVQGEVRDSDVFTLIAPHDAMDKDLPPILLLFRPGHYDILLGPS